VPSYVSLLLQSVLDRKYANDGILKTLITRSYKSKL